MERAIETAARLLKRARVEASEVVGVEDADLVIEVRQQHVERSQRAHHRALAVRVVADGRMGSATTSDLAQPSIERAVRLAVEAMHAVGPSDEAVIPKLQSAGPAIAERVARPLQEVSDDEKIALAMQLEGAAIAADSRIARVQHPCYEERTRRLWVRTSHGTRAFAERGVALCELKAIAADGDEQQSAYDAVHAVSFDALDAEALARDVARRAIAKLGGCPPAAGKRCVLFDARATIELVRLVAASFFADAVQRGKSVVATRRGERFYAPAVSIVDDGLLPDGFGSFPIDAEGTPKRRTAMVEEGRIAGWLYDGARAARDGVASTGNAVRDELRHPPQIGVGNCALLPGRTPRDELLRAVGDGVLVTDLLGVHTANPISGDFSLGAEGVLLEGGQPAEPLRGMTIAGNVHELLGCVEGVADDLRFRGHFGAPTIFAGELMLGG